MKNEPMLHKLTKKIHVLSVKTDDGYNLPVLKVGKGQAVILLHGFGMDAKAWLPFILPLSHKYCFYLPYLRGFGKASHIEFTQENFFKDYVADVVAMRNQLGLNNVILGGISMGAMTCMALHANSEFKGVKKCLFIDQSPVIHNKPDWQWGLMGSTQQEFLGILKDFYQSSEPYIKTEFNDLPDDVKQTMVKAVFTMVGYSFNNKPMRIFAKHMMKHPKLALMMRDTDGWQNQRHVVGGYLNQDFDFRASAPDIDVPIHLVIGKNSKLYHPDGQRAYAQLIKPSKVTEVANAGHALLLDQPIQSYKIIKDFLADG